ncbi:MAG TPA: tetratricopeptide repeat protein [Terriglobia bacterium]|nr:tetratricopeptide repeat protein [Terriglobia bacterium]
MRFIANRIVISLIVIFLMTYFWEFWIKPQTSPLYTEAVAQYHNGQYDRSLELLKSAYSIDPNDSATLTLMGWDYLKKGDPQRAEQSFQRAHELSPQVLDLLLGYAYTEIALKKYEPAQSMLDKLQQKGFDNSDLHVARATLYREVGRTRDAANEFKLALAMDAHNDVAVKNLKEILGRDDISGVSLSFQPIQRPSVLTYTARVNGDYFDWQENGAWKPVYLTGVSMTPALPGHYPVDSVADSKIYDDWFGKISALGVNTIRVYTILPPAFYRSLYQFNTTAGRRPLRILQGVVFGDAPRDDLYNHGFYAACQKEIRDTIDVMHGQGDVAATHAHVAGLYPNDVSPWVAGILVGQEWLSHVVTANNQLHPDLTNYQGAYIKVASGSATEVFLAQMINYAADYEERTYNGQHPLAFLNTPSLDPLRHPTESTILEEISIRRGLGEHVRMPDPPYDDDDGVTVDPSHLAPTDRLKAGYFSAYSIFPYYPDFLDYDPRYQQVHDAQGGDPYLGYLQDLRAHSPGLPLLITDYGVPSSLGIAHINPAVQEFSQGGLSEQQQGESLARLTRNIYDSGAAGGMVFEWVDEWFRQNWLFRNFEVPTERNSAWNNFLDPAQNSGLMRFDSSARMRQHALSGAKQEWGGVPAFYSAPGGAPFHPQGDRYDPARKLRALYADADESFLYLRLEVDKLDNDNNRQPDWKDVNYLVGISTNPGKAGLQFLPTIAPVRFDQGMTYALTLAGPDNAHLWIASNYDPYHVMPVEGIPSQNALALKLGWNASVSASGTFEAQTLEPNRRRFGRDGKYFAPIRYDRGVLRYGSLDPKAPDFNTLAEWHADVQTNSIDMRIPWGLLGVTDPSSFRVVTGIADDGTVQTQVTPGLLLAAFAYRPEPNLRQRDVMQQQQPIADALPAMTGPTTINTAAFKNFRWQGWDSLSDFSAQPKVSYSILQKTFATLPKEPSRESRVSAGGPSSRAAGRGQPGPLRPSRSRAR